MGNHFIFTITGETRDGDYIPARQILAERAAGGRWPLNPATPNRSRLNKGDAVLFYIAGSRDPDAHKVVAHACLTGPVTRDVHQKKDTPAWLKGLAPATYSVPFGRLVWLGEPVDIRGLISALTFIKRPQHWGSYMQGGVIRIPSRDATTLLRGQS